MKKVFTTMCGLALFGMILTSCNNETKQSDQPAATEQKDAGKETNGEHKENHTEHKGEPGTTTETHHTSNEHKTKTDTTVTTTTTTTTTKPVDPAKPGAVQQGQGIPDVGAGHQKKAKPGM